MTIFVLNLGEEIHLSHFSKRSQWIKLYLKKNSKNQNPHTYTTHKTNDWVNPK